ncbi:DUF3365 domain-containing protein [Tenacibaculum sp. IB213877]|uniref:DUF3365 domain-containing protein n=1 Tax=Tenacibaculum sp. IB213877 TaxID=3097351 RepID=UPI002A5A732B|nr:DUF3365 domain-containing protein [Tenacibaculum sp. IB213877]MDY0780994.1 DUF3365 domain-containing protein [Tenacibaculum sp. IB213877]
MKKLAILTVLSFSFLLSCNSKKEKYESTSTKKQEKVAEQKVHPGKKLIKTQCFLCHSPTASHDDRIAPPMIAVKAHYVDANTTKEEFTKKFVDFVTKPTKDKAIMFGAVRRFGVMPKQNYKEEDIKLIAEYIYDYQIEEPDWFKEHWQEMQGKSYINTGKVATAKETKSAADIGLEYALGTKKVLGQNLMGTIQKKGTLEALKFCNEKAYSLTDSMATTFNAAIKRVSDKPRNPKNTATQKEIKIINQYKEIVSNNKTIEPVVEEANGKVQFYYPIVTNSMCLQCHGKPNEQIQPTVLKELAHLYPNDNAKGYDVDQVRGIWNITFKKQ